ncbi:amyloid-beta A4 precursor protein-binding family A member 3 isoform X2 [Corythoichthys intestinalis]|uniref:amyloid-beta A4 precursor protein-binding family A member 3 isoform X2 n=1 Tax=Corythoichthys intestinalis TaxID=161448 RepID=UPI0025A5C179|nr:amyloid-beta A4 precursor protein-binding family A member 3 isoform X2 [Corythoichthys intestinalis]
MDQCPAISSPAPSDTLRLTSPDQESDAIEVDSQVVELDSYSMIEPPPLDWKSDSSTEIGSTEELADDGNSAEKVNSDELHMEDDIALPEVTQEELVIDKKESKTDNEAQVEEDVDTHEKNSYDDYGAEVEDEAANQIQADEDHNGIQKLLCQLQLVGKNDHFCPRSPTCLTEHRHSGLSDLEACSSLTAMPDDSTETTGLLFSESHQRDVLGLLHCEEIGTTSHPCCHPLKEEMDAVVSVSYNQDDAQNYLGLYEESEQQLCREESVNLAPDSDLPKPVWVKLGEEHEVAAEGEQIVDNHPSYKDVPGPCDPEDLLDGVIFGAKYLGSTQLKSDKNPSTNARMAQAQEAVDRIKAPEGETQPMTEVDLFISTQRIKVLSADTEEAMMDHSLQMISYIADIGDIVVLMARRKRKGQETASPSTSSSTSSKPQKCLMICHVFSSVDAQVIAQAIGQAFAVAYQQFLQANGIKASDLRPGEYSDYLESQELYNGDLAHFSDSENIREVVITKAPGEILGLAVVESGWGSIVPTVMVANLLHGGPAECCGELSIGDRIMSVNGTSLVGLPITTCQNIIQICSLMRGGIAERGGIRVGHRIIEINGQSVVATPHDKIIQILTDAVGEIHLKTMPASTYRLLTGQEQPVFL